MFLKYSKVHELHIEFAVENYTEKLQCISRHVPVPVTFVPAAKRPGAKNSVGLFKNNAGTVGDFTFLLDLYI